MLTAFEGVDVWPKLDDISSFHSDSIRCPSPTVGRRVESSDWKDSAAELSLCRRRSRLTMSRYEIMQDKDGQNHHSENPEGQHQARRSTRVPDPSPKEREREGQSRGGASMSFSWRHITGASGTCRPPKKTSSHLSSNASFPVVLLAASLVRLPSPPSPIAGSSGICLSYSQL